MSDCANLPANKNGACTPPAGVPCQSYGMRAYCNCESVYVQQSPVIQVSMQNNWDSGVQFGRTLAEHDRNGNTVGK